MFLVLPSLQSVLAPCCGWLGASDGHESSSTRLAWPSVATRNGLAPSHTNRRAQDLRFFCHRLSANRFATHSHARSNASQLVPVQVSQQPVPQINLVLAFSYFQQPDLLTTEGRHPVSSLRTKGRPVIDSNDLRLAMLLEPQLQLPAHLLMRRSAHHLATEHVTTKQIAGRQGIAAPPVARSKPTFEIHRPHM